MSATESSSSSSSNHSSPTSSPETSKKLPKTPTSSPETSKKVPKTPTSSPETSKKVPKTPTSSPETSKKLPKTPTSSPEAPKKVPKTPTSSPETSKKLPKTPTSSPETSKKLPKTPTSSPETSKKVPKTPTSSPETSKKLLKTPTSSPETSKKFPKTPTSSPEAPKKVNKSFEVLPTASTVHKSPSSSPKVPKKLHKFLTSSPETPEKDHKSSTREREVSPGKLSGNKSFKSSLQVFLKQKQEDELVKNIEFKDKLEKGEIDDEEERKEGRQGSEDGRTDEEEKGRTKEETTKKESMEEETRSEQNQNKEAGQKDGKNKVIEEETASEKKRKVTEKEEEKSKKMAEKERKKRKEMIKKKEKEEKKQSERKVEKAKQEKHVNETEEKEKKREVKKEEETKEEVTKIENKQVEESKKNETRETNGEKEERKEESVRRKKKGTRDERMQGLLYLNRKRTFNAWKEYYFVLDDLLLTYYHSQHHYEGLGCMKGSLDLSLVEEIYTKKPGIMRTHHPFRLSRRNLPHINLAAETKEEQQQWIVALQTAVGPRRLSSSDKTLNCVTKPVSKVNKYSTLPGRVHNIHSCASSTTEEEDNVHEKKAEEEEGEEEEPDLIKPRKVIRVPIGMPLVQVNLDQIKLKKVEKKEVEGQDVKEGKAADVSSSPASTHQDQKHEDQARETSPENLFGVVLKKTKKKEEVEEKESPRETGIARDGSVSPGHTSTTKRPSKQPVIPLNSRKLLIVPEMKEGKSPKVSPMTQKRATPDRRKSPSPSLPISKSVQALTKSAEEVRAVQVDSTSKSLADSAATVEGKGQKGDVKVCHAHTNELKYSDVVDILEVEKVEEIVVKTEDKEKKEREVGEKNEKKEAGVIEGSKEEIKETIENGEDAVKEDGQKQKEEEDVKKVPLDTLLKVAEDETEDKDKNKEVVPAALKDTSDEETFGEMYINNDNKDNKQVEAATEKHKKDESSSLADKIQEFEVPHPHPLAESSSAATPLTPPASPASSVDSTDPKTVPSSPKPDPPSPGAPVGIRDLKEEIHSSTQADKRKTDEEQEEVGMVHIDVPRDRTSTNESTASSIHEGGEKKAGKFKSLKNKFKSGGSVKVKKEDPVVQREPKEKKRRGSNAFTVLLQGKRTKEGSKKPAEEEPQPLQLEDTSRSRAAPLHEVIPTPDSLPTEAKALPPLVAAVVDVQVTPPTATLPSEEDLEGQVNVFLAGSGSADVGMVALRTATTHVEARDSACSHTSNSSRDDLPPSIPEKKHMRARSPYHDVPKNNRPVTNIHMTDPEVEDKNEDENIQKVDGYITEEQIDAMLNAKENREKKKRSLSRSHMYAMPDVVKGSWLTSEEWAMKRPSYNSFSSIDSDDQLPTTNFLSCERQLSSSDRTDGGEGSSFDSGDSLDQDMEVPAEGLWRAPRPTDGITAKNRVSLTSSKFTVKEEEALSSPETPKARPTQDNGNEDNDADEKQHSDDEDEPEVEAEHDDFFPVVGGDVQLRQPASLDLPTGDLRTSGIVSLKEYLETQEEGDLQEIKSGISRLGHSAAVEKLKQTTSEQ